MDFSPALRSAAPAQRQIPRTWGNMQAAPFLDNGNLGILVYVRFPLYSVLSSFGLVQGHLYWGIMTGFILVPGLVAGLVIRSLVRPFPGLPGLKTRLLCLKQQP